jgi:catalase
MPAEVLSGPRERQSITKENNFAQPGARFRSWDNARQERWLGRIADMLLDPRCTKVGVLVALGVLWVCGWGHLL